MGFFVIIRNLPRIIFLLPSTYLHELCHLVVALLCGHKIVGFSIFPKISKEGTITLGSVSSLPIINITFVFVGMAPLLLLGLAWLLVVKSPYLSMYIYDGSLYFSASQALLTTKNGLFTLFLLAQLLIGAKPSSVDFRVAFLSLLKPFGKGL